MKPPDAKKTVVVIGAGPAGMMAAIRAAALSCRVVLVEKNPILGKKLLLSGKGRCNLTNACDLDAFLKRFSRNGQFLRSAFSVFFNRELIDFFERRGLRLKTERQLRVFPVTDRSASIVGVLGRELERQGVEIVFKESLRDIFVQGGSVKGVLLSGMAAIACSRLVLATGGLTYAFTGSTGEGLEFARRLGHRIEPPRPGLVPLETKEGYPKLLQGLSLKNIRLHFSDGQQRIVSEVGEMLFTSTGISGPLVLTLSGRVCEWLEDNGQVQLEIDLKPALSSEQLHARLVREFKLNAKKSIRNCMKELLPARMVGVFLEKSAVPADRKSSQITRREREAIVTSLKHFRLGITGARPLDEAMVMRGGVSLKDIDPRTMASRLVRGLYFAGEMIDVDADTGGFNLQAAFSTGYLAGQSAASA